MAKIERFRGDTKADTFTIRRADGGLVDITGFTFRMTINTLQNPDVGTPGTILYSLTGTITNALRGEVEFVPSAVQADQAPADYFYDVEMTDTTSRITTIVKDVYTFKQDISK